VHSKSVSRPPLEWLSTTAEPFSFHFIPSHTSANELSCGALSPYGCELTLKKLEPHADGFPDLRPLCEVQSLQLDLDDVRAGRGL